MLVAKEVGCRCKEKQMFKPFASTTSKVVGVFGNEVLKDTLRTETIKPKIGLTCDKGHRYLCSKTVADVMEALIGAYLDLGRHCEGALKFMVWAGIDVDYDPGLMKVASEESPVDLSCDYGMDVKALEKRIGYTFKNKYLLLEAMTHTSNISGDRIRCYQVCTFQLLSLR
jgi:endoribonuclease Dicer